MIDIDVYKIEVSGYTCNNPNCEHDEKYHHNIIGKVYHIKQGTMIAFISLTDNSSSASNIYCEGCIDEIYKIMKQQLDKKLWIFK